jgi:hypothetical protein
MAGIRGQLTYAWLALVVACAPADQDGMVNVCAGAKCDDLATTAAAIELPEVLRCWVERGSSSDDFFRVDEVRCRWTRLPAPVQANGVTLNLRGKDGRATGGEFLDEKPAGVAHVVMRLRESDYPLAVKLQHSARLTGESSDNLPSSIVAEQTILDSGSATAASPLIFRAPYDLWQVRFIGRTSFGALQLDEVQVPLAPFRDGRIPTPADPTSWLARYRLPFVRSGQIAEAWLAVPAGTGALRGTAHAAGATSPASLPGPGVYTFDDGGMRPATAADLAATSPDAATATTDAEPAPIDAAPGHLADAREAPDAGAADATSRTCGVDGLACCGGTYGSCDPGHNCSGGTCRACGTDGLACCGGIYGTCDPSHNCSGGTCRACGTDGLACCGGTYGTCEQEHNCSGGTCRACGGAGEPCCGGTYGTCDTGLSCRGGSCS